MFLSQPSPLPDNQVIAAIAQSNLLGYSSAGFINLTQAIIGFPANNFITAGENGTSAATSSLFYNYSSFSGLHVDVTPGYLTNTAQGDGGFSLTVTLDGSWALQFDNGNTIGHVSGSTAAPPTHTPPTGNSTVNFGPGATSYNGTAGNLTTNGGTGYDTVQGGVGDYMIGGSGTLGGGLAGAGNCAVYTSSPGSVLVDMQNGYGYGANAEGNQYVNMNQTRGSLFSNVLIGNANGTDLKSGGNNSLLISTGGNGYELRPDGTNNILVSTVGADRIVFDSTHGWALGDDNIALGFNTRHGNALDLTQVLSGGTVMTTTGQTESSNFFSASATGYDPSTGQGDINQYVKVVDAADGSHVFVDPMGNVATAGVEVLDIKMVHGLTASGLLASHSLIT